MALTGQGLLDYACTQFENGVYDAALEAFVLAYAKEYEKEWVLENIYNCYMAGNEVEFQESYGLWDTGEKPAYESLTLDFIPYREGEYYIFDKAIQNFRGVFSVNSVQSVIRQEEFKKTEFSALAVAMDWNWSSLPDILAEAKFRKLYAVCQDMNRCASFFKIPELSGYVGNIMLFPNMEEFQGYFHEHTSVYLPKLCVGKEDGKQKLLEITNKEHGYRLTPEGRNTDNVLLTIGIPTHDRGHLLLKRLEKLVQMPYDAEVEFAISKNGVLFYQEEYRQASKIADARINYEGHDKEVGPSKNWQNVIKIAHGRFVLLVSDEDDVIISALEHYLYFLKEHSKVGLVRAKTVCQYSILEKGVYSEKGEEAFFSGWLHNNYVSGSIYNREMFLNAKISYLDICYCKNEFFRIYPHMCWNALMAFEGDYAEDVMVLIQEGDSVAKEEMEGFRKAGVSNISDYETGDARLSAASTYDGRIKQFQGAAELIWDFDKLNQEMKVRALDMIIWKTLYLMDIVYRDYKYKPEEYPGYLEKLVDEIIKIAQQWKLAAEWQRKILGEVSVYLAQIIESA